VGLGLGEMGLGEMVMMFAVAGGDVVRSGCECGRLVLPWVWEVGVAVGWLYGWSVEKKYIKKELFYNILI
jgi:hypothetical protein